MELKDKSFEQVINTSHSTVEDLTRLIRYLNITATYLGKMKKKLTTHQKLIFESNGYKHTFLDCLTESIKLLESEEFKTLIKLAKEDLLQEQKE